MHYRNIEILSDYWIILLSRYSNSSKSGRLSDGWLATTLVSFLTIATLSSILDSQLNWESGKFQLARWSHEVVIYPKRTGHPPTIHMDFIVECTALWNCVWKSSEGVRKLYGMFPKEQEEVRSQIFFYPKSFGTNFFGNVANFRFKNKHNFLGEPSKQKMSQIVEKVHNFLDPPR